MLEPGARLPSARVWTAPREGPVDLAQALAGFGPALLCFYPFDWSPGCTNEVLFLGERKPALDNAGIRPFGISRDSPWSHAAWAMTLGIETVPLLSDWSGEATVRFGVSREFDGMTGVAARSAFLIDDAIVRASWLLDGDLPDLDAVIAAASGL